jgi:hypothetical protein
MKLGRQRGEHFLGVVSDPLALCAGLKNSTAGFSSGARAQCPGARWTSSTHRTVSGGSTGVMSRLTTTGSWPLRMTTHSSGSLRELELQHLHLAALDGD